MGTAGYGPDGRAMSRVRVRWPSASTRAEFREREAPVMMRFWKLLGELVAVNAELAELDLEEENSLGGAVWLSWPDLLVADTPLAPSRPLTWRRFVETEGFDV